MLENRLMITGWAMCLACMLMMSCRVQRNTEKKTVMDTMEDVKVMNRTTEVSMDELMRRVSERENLHVIWYMPEENLEGTDRPPVMAEAWTEKTRDEETVENNEKTVVRKEENERKTKEHDETEQKSATRTRMWPEWWEILLVVMISGWAILWTIRKK